MKDLIAPHRPVILFGNLISLKELYMSGDKNIDRDVEKAEKVSKLWNEIVTITEIKKQISVQIYGLDEKLKNLYKQLNNEIGDLLDEKMPSKLKGETSPEELKKLFLDLIVSHPNSIEKAKEIKASPSILMALAAAFFALHEQ